MLNVRMQRDAGRLSDERVSVLPSEKRAFMFILRLVEHGLHFAASAAPGSVSSASEISL